jgi:hypothetical protein
MITRQGPLVIPPEFGQPLLGIQFHGEGDTGAEQDAIFNPERIVSFSPGLARFREGLPWVTAFKVHNPERVEYQTLTKQIQPFQGCDFSVFSPRVARASQPWAKSFNPVGIGKTNDEMTPPISLAIPPKTAKNRVGLVKSLLRKVLNLFSQKMTVFKIFLKNLLTK